MEKVEVVDEHTVNVVSKGPFPVLLARMTYAGSGSVVMLPPKYVQEKGDDFAAHPIGTGPFKFVEWVKGDRVTLEANPDYWRGKPKVQRVTFRFVPETATRIASLLNGETDIIENIPPDQVERVAGSPNAVVGKTSDGMIVAYYQFDTRAESPVKNRKVREAINHAIDWDTIVKDLLRGHARRRPVPLDPGDLGMNAGVKTFAYDPEKAKKLLAEAGYPGGFTFTMPTSNGRYMEDRAVTEAIAAYLGKVGIKATVQPTEWGVYLKMLAEKRTGPVFIIGWGSGLFDADVLVDEFGCKVTVLDLLQRAGRGSHPEGARRGEPRGAREALPPRPGAPGRGRGVRRRLPAGGALRHQQEGRLEAHDRRADLPLERRRALIGTRASVVLRRSSISGRTSRASGSGRRACPGDLSRTATVATYLLRRLMEALGVIVAVTFVVFVAAPPDRRPRAPHAAARGAGRRTWRRSGAPSASTRPCPSSTRGSWAASSTGSSAGRSATTRRPSRSCSSGCRPPSRSRRWRPLLAVLTSVPLGIGAAVRPGSALDRLCTLAGRLRPVDAGLLAGHRA